ncbi:SDR family NAD(P)-dependent oxidoreductase [Salinibacillus xinjiangensis]|uniref:Glucose 1-dehydrogenase n=1 Tax=Salinibacillus xinjiangensis TaxID=1229268 RepID=A0A6G1X1S2_9BACI|nr:SDR family oxidoreductase [Salinibacillus xinjiangensis]MRG84889.1 glucose 1-dehydrogenase [Salinibacillus xinjiangensis]
MDRLLDLSGKVAVVTGGSRGIGRQIVLDFAEHGADVVIVGRNKTKCDEVAQEVNQMGQKGVPISADVAKQEDIESIFNLCTDVCGKVDILVNNAGTNSTNKAINVTEAEWDYIFDVNLKGLFFSSQQAAKIMISQKSGKIINISSAGGSRAYRNIAPYAASKAAVIHLTRSLSNEWARYNIHVNSIAPGLISTDINKDDIADPEVLDRMIKMIPQRRLGHPKDIASMALYLAADASNYITGQTLFVDGGKTVE